MTGERQHRNRGIGRDAVHLAIDDYSRVSLSKVLPEEADRCVTQFLRGVPLRQAGVRIDRVITGAGSGYVPKASRRRVWNWASDTSGPGPTRP